AGGRSRANAHMTGPGSTNRPGPNCSDPKALPSANTNHTYPNCPDGLFMFHHHPFDYFANYAPGTPGRAHLQDETVFKQLATSSDKNTCNLKPVSFVNPSVEETEHQAYATTHTGQHSQ